MASLIIYFIFFIFAFSFLEVLIKLLIGAKDLLDFILGRHSYRYSSGQSNTVYVQRESSGQSDKTNVQGKSSDQRRKIYAQGLLNQHIIDLAQYNQMMAMNNMQQDMIIQQQIQQMDQEQQRLFYEQAEQAHLSATGIEFGGYNPDINLNPGMSFQEQSNYDYEPPMDIGGGFNDFGGGFDDFGGGMW